MVYVKIKIWNFLCQKDVSIRQFKIFRSLYTIKGDNLKMLSKVLQNFNQKKK